MLILQYQNNININRFFKYRKNWKRAGVTVNIDSVKEGLLRHYLLVQKDFPVTIN